VQSLDFLFRSEVIFQTPLSRSLAEYHPHCFYHQLHPPQHQSPDPATAITTTYATMDLLILIHWTLVLVERFVVPNLKVPNVRRYVGRIGAPSAFDDLVYSAAYSHFVTITQTRVTEKTLTATSWYRQPTATVTSIESTRGFQEHIAGDWNCKNWLLMSMVIAGGLAFVFLSCAYNWSLRMEYTYKRRQHTVSIPSITIQQTQPATNQLAFRWTKFAYFQEAAKSATRADLLETVLTQYLIEQSLRAQNASFGSRLYGRETRAERELAKVQKELRATKDSLASANRSYQPTSDRHLRNLIFNLTAATENNHASGVTVGTAESGSTQSVSIAASDNLSGKTVIARRAPVPAKGSEVSIKSPTLMAPPSPVISEDGATQALVASTVMPDKLTDGAQSGEISIEAEREEITGPSASDECASEARTTKETMSTQPISESRPEESNVVAEDEVPGTPASLHKCRILPVEAQYRVTACQSRHRRQQPLRLCRPAFTKISSHYLPQSRTQFGQYHQQPLQLCRPAFTGCASHSLPQGLPKSQVAPCPTSQPTLKPEPKPAPGSDD
jgi:hypothetical protein